MITATGEDKTGSAAMCSKEELVRTSEVITATEEDKTGSAAMYSKDSVRPTKEITTIEGK